MGRVRASELDAVTLDSYGTLVTLVDPIPALRAALAREGVERGRDEVTRGFRAEVAHYTQHSATGRDEAGLAVLQRDCARVFLDAVGAELDANAFAPVYAGAMHFKLLPGVREALDRLRSLGLALAVVANWDLTLHARLEEVGLTRYFGSIVHAAEKPAPDGLLRALAELDVEASRTLHVGDDEADEAAAHAAHVHFAFAPLPDAAAAVA
jgi:HAD superfamily hydrolase (TIGR01509 family)